MSELTGDVLAVPISQETTDSEAVLKSRGRREEVALHTTSQRKINMIWEVTQAFIAITVVVANIAAMFMLANPSEMMGNAFFLVIGFYFGRTNHERQSGVEMDYKGR
jgi:hypothetical protein